MYEKGDRVRLLNQVKRILPLMSAPDGSLATVTRPYRGERYLYVEWDNTGEHDQHNGGYDAADFELVERVGIAHTYELRKISVCRHVIEEASSLPELQRLCLTKYGIPTRSWTVGVGGYWWNAGGNIGCGFKGSYQILEVPNENSI